jgi:pimeloyl-ACP methyl ester carboxylesterase
MRNYRTWGKPPYSVAVIHGGPGIPGSIAPVAMELAKVTGVLEPLQTRDTLEGQVAELHAVLQENSALPVALIGHSWGATLAFIYAARYPARVRKLILIGSGPFEEKYADSITPERLNRLSETERVEAFKLIDTVNDPSATDRDKPMARLGEIFAKADSYDALPREKEPEPLPVSEAINRRVWAEARPLRTGGKLLKMGERIACPVVAIHGDYDPHPAAGVKGPLRRVLKDFRFILLEKCGHEPWVERFARKRFYAILKDEIK